MEGREAEGDQQEPPADEMKGVSPDVPDRQHHDADQADQQAQETRYRYGRIASLVDAGKVQEILDALPDQGER